MIVDRQLLLLINTGIKSEYLDGIFIFLTSKGYLLFIPFLIYLCFRIKDKKELFIFVSVFFASFAIADWLANELKGVFLRPRPCVVELGLRDVIGCSNTFSMPSNHACNSTAVATVLLIQFLRLKTNLFISVTPMFIAIAISISRVYLGVHYPSDVFAGILVGFVVSLVVVSSFNKIKDYYAQRPIETTLFLVNLVLFLFRLYYIRHGGLDLSPDEAHYWEWSRQLDLSYYSKGPLIAYLIKLSTSIFGNTNTGVRIFAPVMLTISSLFMYALTYRIALGMTTNLSKSEQEYISKATALFASMTLHIIPLYSVYGIVFTIDSPFLMLWVMALYQFERIISQGGNTKQWILLGIIVGFGLLAKYTMAFFIVCVGTYLILSNRKALLTSGPYLFILTTTLLFLPVLLFNYKHNWVTIRHTLGQANIQEGIALNLRYFFEFLGSQVGLLSVVFPVLMIYSFFVIRRASDKKILLYILSFSLPVLGFFTIKSLQGKVQANWALPAYIVLIIPMAYIVSLSRFGVIKKRVFNYFSLGLAVSILISFAGLYPHFFKVPLNLDPSARLRGWAMLAQEVDKVRNSLAKDGRWLILSDSYQITSELAFYLNDKPIVYCINLNRRMNQYDLWESPNDVLDKIKASKSKANAIFVTNALMDSNTKRLFDSTDEIAKRCERSVKHIVSVGHKNRILRNYAVLICYNLDSLPKNEIKSF